MRLEVNFLPVFPARYINAFPRSFISFIWQIFGKIKRGWNKIYSFLESKTSLLAGLSPLF